VILDKNGNIFRGFTPLPWMRIYGSQWKDLQDARRKSFLFTLENPFNLPPMKFRVKSAEATAISYVSTRAPLFGLDLGFWWKGDSDGFTNLGKEYEYTIKVPGDGFLTGAPDFSAKEIEVFEIID
jgi:hypothetical protein